MSAPGRYYVYKADGDKYELYEIKPETYKESPLGTRFRATERLLTEPTGIFGCKWADNGASHHSVLGWYDTIAEAIFAMEVLL